MLGAFLFFIPRIYWDEKPVGSGELLSNSMGLFYDNISMSLIGELYINFWYFGVFFGAVILGLLLSYFDDINSESDFINTNPSSHISYLLMVPILLILLRGDLLSSLSFCIGILISVRMWLLISSKVF